ncbi:MAG TPA: fructosamine kinase family protein [Alphaproteobacteria bacterium]
MTLPATAKTRIEAALGSPIRASSALGGGQIAEVSKLDLADGRAAVAKCGANLAIEAMMLRYLANLTRVPVPAVRLADDDLLVMDYVENDRSLSPSAETHLADIVADLHAMHGRQFGFDCDTVIGSLPQPNPATDDWRGFFRDHRLLAMARTAHEAGRLSAALRRRLETLGGRLERWIRNDAPPTLIHGDLWAGNILSHGDRITALIDPALYFADPEIELAFMTLFGSVSDRFFARYRERAKLRPGFFEERRDLYNLYPLLVHVRLFGGSYVAQVERTLSRYGC